MAESRSVLIAGGGIAGLTAALCFSKIGYHVEVFEQSEKFEAIGAGIQLSPNALRILDDLGVGRHLRMTSTTPQAIRILNAWRGKQLAEVPLGAEAITQFGLPYICVHRADLHQALLIACNDDPDIRVNMGNQVLDCTHHSNGVSALVKKKDKIETHRGKLFICADGIKSKIRSEIFEQNPYTHTGFEAWRAMIPAEKVPNNFPMDFTHLIMGRGAHAVFYPVRNGRYLNVVVVLKSKSPKDNSDAFADPTFLRKKTRFWNSSFRKMFADTNDWSVWPILATPETKSWRQESMVMIGDAAHGMPPFAAQGAALAIEDAQVLANCVNQNDDTDIALTEFQKLRIPRVNKVAKLARTNRQLYHMGFPFSLVRNLGMHFTPKKRLLDRQAWIYNWRP